MNKRPVLSICIVSYNTREMLRDCLHSLAEHAPRVPWEVIIVDNQSADGSVEVIKTEFPNVKLISLTSHEGYTKAMNCALKVAQGQYLVQLNPDTLIKTRIWDELIKFMQTHPDVGICTPKVLNRDGTLQNQCRRSAAGPWDTFCYVSGLSRLFPKNRRFAGYLMTYMDMDVVHPCEAVSGSCMFIRREVIERIGYLDEVYYAYQEDSDFCFRARLAGFQVYYVPLTSIIHYGGQGGSLVNARKSIYEWHRSYWIYYRRYFSPNHFFLVNWLVFIATGLRLSLRLFISLFQRQEYVGSRKP